MGFHSDDFAYPGLIPSESETHDARAHRPQILTISLGHLNEDDSVEENGSSPQSLSAGASPDFQGPSSDGSHSSPSSPGIELHNVKPQSIRQRTAQACDKCRERKTKCSGNRPVCLRCTNRGLICEYSVRESRIRTMRTRTNTSIAFPNPLQVNFHDGVRPTPAHHSRLGNCQKQAFASSLSGAYTTSPPSHTPRLTHSSSAARFGNNIRLGVSRQVAHDLDTRYYSGGYAVALNSGRSHDGQVPRWNSSRPQSHSTLPQYRDPSRVATANTLFNIASTSVREAPDFLHCGYDCLDKSMAGGQPLVPSIHPEEHTILEGGSAKRIIIPDAPFLESGFNSMGAYSSIVLVSPNEKGHEPSSISAFSEQNNSENYVHRYMNEPSINFHLPLYRSNQSDGGHSDWINISSSNIPSNISEPSAPAVHYDTIINDNVAEEDNFCLQYGRHSSASSASLPSSASNPSGASSQASSMTQLELLCPAPIMLIGSGGYGAPLTEKVSYDSHDNFHHHHSGDLGMLVELGQQRETGGSALGETHYNSYNAPSVADPGHRFQGYDFLK